MACSSYKRTRITDIFIAEQTACDFESPTVGDVYRLDAGTQAQATPELIERDILKGSYTPEANMVGVKIGNVNGVSEMYGADYSDGVTRPYFNDLFRASQLIDETIEEIPVSSITTNFVRGETVTGTSGVGEVLIDTLLSDTTIIVRASVPGFTLETVSGSISGVAECAGVEVDRGVSYKFDSTATNRLSVRVEEDGQKSELYNAVPTLSITSDDSNIPRLNYDIQGVIVETSGVAQWSIDAAATPNIVRDQQLPPLFQNARLKYNTTLPVIDATLSLDLAMGVGARRDANSVGGIEGFIVTGRKPMLSYQMDRPDSATLPIISDWFESAQVSNSWRFGDKKFNCFYIFAEGRLQNVQVADQDGISKFALEFGLTSALDDGELEILAI